MLNPGIGTVLAAQPSMNHKCDEIWLLLDSSGFGGIESHVSQLAPALKRRGLMVRVVFLTDHGSHPLKDKFAETGIAFECLNGGWRSLSETFRRRPRLVHTHGYKAGIQGRLMGRLTGVPVVSTYHAGEPGEGWLRLYNHLDWLTAWLAPAIAVSRPIAERVWGAATVVRNFVISPDRAPQRFSGHVLFLGRLSPEKGVDLFCEMARRLPSIRFEVAGDGPMRRQLEESYGDTVTFLGAVDDMPERWKDYGLLCMPSRHEGLPMAALEAMGNGVPVAAFAVGALPQVIEHGCNGWLAKPGDLEALTKCIAGWCGMDDAARRKISKAARSTIVENYSPEAVLPDILDVYARAGAVL